MTIKVAHASNNNPAITFTASASTVTSGTPVTLTWSATCPTSTCTYSIDQGVGSVATSSSVVVTPAATKTYTFMVNNASVGVFISTVTVFVGTGSLSVSQSVAALNGGPGCSSVSKYGVCEITYTYAGAGCSSYSPSLTACSGGTVTNPWEDVTIAATFTGRETGTVVHVGGFYEGGINSGNGNQWKVRFSPQVSDVWDYSATFSSPTDYKIFTNNGLFMSAAIPQGSGFLSLYGAGNPYILKTPDGKAFYPISINNYSFKDLGDNVAGSMTLSGAIGSGPSPVNGGQSAIPPAGTVLSKLAQSGFNMLRIGAGFGAVTSLSILSPNNNTYRAGNAGLSQVAGAITWDDIVRQSNSAGLKNWCTVINSPSGFVPSLNVFTTPATTQAYMHAWQTFINRYAAYCNVWELGNEVDQTVATPFLTSLAAWIKQQDPYHHLTAISYQTVPSAPIANLDLQSDHEYISYAVNPLLTLASNFGSLITTQHSNLPSAPIIYGEIGNTSSGVSDPPANEQLRQFQNVAFFKQAFVTPWPDFACNGDAGGSVLCVGTQQQAQVAVFSSFISSLDPAATALSVSLSGGTNGQTLIGYALGSNTDLGGYIVNTTNRTVVHNATVTVTIPAASMAGEWIAPSTGKVISTFTTSGTPGSQAITIPDFSNTAQNGDIWFRIRGTAVPVVTTVTAPGCLVAVSCPLTLTAAGGTGSYTWAVTSGSLPAGLTLNAATGAITGTPTIDGNWNFSVAATDNSKVMSSPQNLILVVFAPIAVGNTNLDSLVIGQGVSAAHPVIVITGGMPPVSCSITSGLPPGVTSNSYCGLSGTPTTAGTYPFTVTATDGLGNSTSSVVTTTVASSVIGIEETNLSNPTVNTPFNLSNIQSRKGTGAVTWAVTAGSLPTGLSLSVSGSQASITGTPTVVGTNTFSLTATDSASHVSDPAAYTMIVSPLPSITTNALPAYTGGAYSSTIATSGGNAPLWCQLTGALPTGIVLDNANCRLYGTTSGYSVYPITISAFDSNGATASKSFIFQTTGGASNHQISDTGVF